MAIDKNKMKENLKNAGSKTGEGLKKAGGKAGAATKERAKNSSVKEKFAAVGMFAVVCGGALSLVAGTMADRAELQPQEDPYTYTEPAPVDEPTDDGMPMGDDWEDTGSDDEAPISEEEPEAPIEQTHGRYIGIAITASDADDDITNAEFEYTITRTDTGEEMMTEKGQPHQVAGDWQYYFEDLTEDTELEISGTLDGLPFSTTISENTNGAADEVDQHFLNVELFNGGAYIEETT